MDPTSTAQPTVLTPEQIAVLPARALGAIEGVTNRVLWQDVNSMAGVLTVEAGHQLGAHTHRQNHHHLWVLDGAALILDVEVGPGCYVHVPSGVEHDIDARGTGGCTVYYLYILPGT